MSRHRNIFERLVVPLRWEWLFSVALALLFFPSFSPNLLADEIYFTSGYSETGVVVRETDAYVRFKTEMGLVTISQEKIDFIEKASDEENQAMLKKWREKERRDEEQLEAKREAERKFELEQIEKGLVNFEGDWMTPERRQEIINLRKEARADRKQFEQKQIEKGLSKFQYIWVTPAVEEELVAMEKEIEALVEQIESDRLKVDSFRAAMLKAPSFSEAEDFASKMEEISARIEQNSDKLNRLLKKADDIEAVSVKYKTPEKYIDVLPPEEVFP